MRRAVETGALKSAVATGRRMIRESQAQLEAVRVAAYALEALRPLEVMGRAADLSQLLERLVRVIAELASLPVGPA